MPARLSGEPLIGCLLLRADQPAPRTLAAAAGGLAIPAASAATVPAADLGVAALVWPVEQVLGDVLLVLLLLVLLLLLPWPLLAVFIASPRCSRHCFCAACCCVEVAHMLLQLLLLLLLLVMLLLRHAFGAKLPRVGTHEAGKA